MIKRGLYTGLPNGYTPVDYIQSSGTQYIKTNYILSFNDVIRVYDLVCPKNSALQCIFQAGKGASTSDHNTYFEIYDNGSYSSSARYAYFKSSLTYLDDVADLTSETTIQLDKSGIYYNYMKVGNVTYTSTGIANNDLYIFAGDFNSAVSHYATARFSEIIIYDYDTHLVKLDLVPCFRHSDSVVGLYDTISNTFYTNQGTGVFTYGEVAGDKITDIYLGSNKISKVYLGTNLVYSSIRFINFASNPAPISWTKVSNTDYISTNLYGTWEIIASELYTISPGSVDNSFDNDTSTYCRYVTNSTLEIDFPQNVYIHPTIIDICNVNCKSTSKVQGYNIDTNSWEDLGTFGGTTAKITNNIIISNTNYYSKIRLNMVRYSSAAAYCAIYELQIRSGTLKITS